MLSSPRFSGTVGDLDSQAKEGLPILAVRDGDTAFDRHLPDPTVGEEANPLAIGREEGVRAPFRPVDRPRLE